MDQASRESLRDQTQLIRETTHVIDVLAGGTTEPEPPAGPQGSQSLLVVGKDAVGPSQVATVEILGGTNFEAQSVALGVGIRPEAGLELVSYEVAPELVDILRIDAPQTIVKQQKGAGWYESFIQVNVLFFQTIGDVLNLDPETAPRNPKREIVDAVIPQMTPLLLLHLKVPESAPAGEKITLDIQHTYGRKLSSSGPIKQLDWTNLYGTRLDVSRTGVKVPKESRVSGWIDVL